MLSFVLRLINFTNSCLWLFSFLLCMFLSKCWAQRHLVMSIRSNAKSVMEKPCYCAAYEYFFVYELYSHVMLFKVLSMICWYCLFPCVFFSSLFTHALHVHILLHLCLHIRLMSTDDTLCIIGSDTIWLCFDTLGTVKDWRLIGWLDWDWWVHGGCEWFISSCVMMWMIHFTLCNEMNVTCVMLAKCTCDSLQVLTADYK